MSHALQQFPNISNKEQQNKTQKTIKKTNRRNPSSLPSKNKKFTTPYSQQYLDVNDSSATLLPPPIP